MTTGLTNAIYVGGGAPAYDGKWAYDGAHTTSFVELQGQPKTLVTITGNGFLQIAGDILLDIWMIGGGGAGYFGRYGSSGGFAGGGGAGGYTQWIFNAILGGMFELVIGAGGNAGSYSGTTITAQPTAGGQTRFGDLWAVNGGNPGNQSIGGSGGTGAGSGGSAGYGGNGDRKTTRPWNGEIAGIGFQSGGGTGGTWTVNGNPNATNAQGGSNGSNGGAGRGDFGYGSHGRGGNGGSAQNSGSGHSMGTAGTPGIIYLLLDGEIPEGL